MIYSDDEIDAHLVLLTNHMDALQDAIDNNYTLGFNQSNIKSLVQKTKDIIELEKEIRRGLFKILDDCGDTSTITNWIEFYDALSPIDNQVYVKQGSHSMALGIDADKDPADLGRWDNSGVAFGDLSAYEHDWVYLWVYFPTLDYLKVEAAFYYYIGTDIDNFVYFISPKTSLSVGWNLIKYDLDNPYGEAGTTDWTDINFQGIRVYTMLNNTNDFTFYVDSIMFVQPL